MATLVLVRHGRTTANATGVLAGRATGIDLDDHGRAQVESTAGRLAPLDLAAVVSSPLARCRQTAEAIVARQVDRADVSYDPDLVECDYGAWQGRSTAELAEDPLWDVVQRQPAAVVFPGGESMVAMQARAVEAVRRRDAAIEAGHGPGAVWAAVSHGDVIKAVLADALGLHLDLFQRITVHPGSVSVVRYAASRPEVVAMNTAAGDLAWLAATTPATGAVVGGGAGPDAPVAERSYDG